MAFSGKAGTVQSKAGNMVAGFGSSSVHYSTSFTASISPTVTTSKTRTYVFDQVSITVYRAVSRSLKYLSIFRTEK